MAITLNDNILTDAPKPSDSRYGIYTNINEALTNVPAGKRYQGLTVGIITDGVVSEYWFKNGITDLDLIAKIPDSFIVRHDFVDGIPAYNYLGKAIADSLDSETVWTIKKLAIDANGTTTITSAIDVNWTNRYTHTYL